MTSERAGFIASTACCLLLTASAGAQSAPVMDLSVRLPAGVRTGQVAVAGDTFTLEVGADVAGSPDSVVTHMGSLRMYGVGGNLPTVYTVGGVNLVAVRVNGNLYSEGLVTGALSRVTGSVIRGSFGRRTETRHVEYPPTSGGNVNAIGPFANVTLAPGRYDDITVTTGGTLRLSAGKYYLRRLLLSTSGDIVINTSAGPVEIYVTNSMSLTGDVLGDASKILVGYSGTFPSNVSGNFNGTVLAPSSTLTITGGLLETQRGAFFARAIVLTAVTRIRHVVSQIFDPTRIARISTAWQPIAGYDPGFVGCPPPIDLPATIIVDPVSGRDYFQDLHYPLHPLPCQSAIQSCNAAGTPIARPTEAQLNARPPVGSRCDAVGTALASAECGINPTTVTGPCSAGCAPDQICGMLCLDNACTQSGQYCGKRYESCAPLAASTGDCETYHQCPDPRDVGTFLAADTLATIAPQNAPGPDALPDAEVAVASYALLTDICKPDGTFGTSDAKEEKGSALDFGSGKWGVKLDISGDLGFGMGNLGKILESGDITANSGAEVSIEARVMGNKVDVFSVRGGVEKDKCGWRFASDLLVFGDSVVSADSSSGVSSGLPPLGPDRETPNVERNECESIFVDRREKAGGVRHANFLVRTVVDHYDRNGLSDYTCARANSELGGHWDCSMAPFRTQDPPDIIEEWKQHYLREGTKFVAVDGSFKAKEDAMTASGQLQLFKIRQAYSMVAASASVPLGPVSVVVAFEAFGFWEISGSLQAHASYGIGFGDFWDSDAGGLGKPTFPNSLERDLRLALGPLVVPGAGVTALAYAGIGLGPVSVGLEGQVDLVTISFPASLMGSLGRVTVPNRVVPPLWSGTPIPGMAPRYAKTYDWQYNLYGRVGMQLGVLNGRINLAARVDLWFWSKTWRIKLADFRGYNQFFPFVQGNVAGEPVVTAADFGTEGNNVEFTLIPGGTAFVPQIVDPLFHPPVFKNECLVVP